MSKQTPVVEWYVAESDADWARLGASPRVDSQRSGKRYRASVVAILLLISASVWWWHMAQARLHATTTELNATAQRELSAVVQGHTLSTANLSNDQALTDWQLQLIREASGLRTALLTSETDVQFDLTLHTVEVQGDQAVATVLIRAKRGATTYRQTRVYQRTATTWMRAAPDAALWGPMRQLETPTFLFHFRQHDAAAVVAVAPQVETLYTRIRRDFGLAPLPTAEKLVIEVSATHALVANLDAPHVFAQLTVPSPALYLAPVDLRDDQLLAQAIALPLLSHLMGQLIEHQAIDQTWRPLLDGLRLWQLWELALPLSDWREEIVQWVYRDLPASQPGQRVVLPTHYLALCAAHHLWLPSPEQMGIPLACWDQESWLLAEWNLHAPPRQLAQLIVPVKVYMMQPSATDWFNQLSQPVALATLVEYAVAAYGRERLPVLVAGLGQYKTWDTLLPAVYGVSPAEFETGWQAYLATHYGVSPAQVDAAK